MPYIIKYYDDNIYIPKPIDRSWMKQETLIQNKIDKNKLNVIFKAKWKNISPNLYIRYSIWLECHNKEPYLIVSTQAAVSKNNEYRGCCIYPPPIGRTYDIVCDYEIWKGKPDKGELLYKNSEISLADPVAAH